MDYRFEGECMSEQIKAYFEEIHNQLKQLEKKYNPKGGNLHFADEAIPKADVELFYDLLQLSGKALEIIKDEENHYSNKTPYASAMFSFWYDYFLIVSSASIRIKESANSDDFSQETIYGIIEYLINIREFAVIVSGDLYKRNYEALVYTILAFYSENLINVINKKKNSTPSKEVKSFLDGILKKVKEILNSC